MSDSFVSEYPLPPSHYKDFTTENALMHPIIKGENLRNISFGSSVQSQHLNFDNNLVYKNELKMTIKKLMAAFCQVIDVQDPPEVERLNFSLMDEKFAEINDSIRKFQQLIDGYRGHQAREDLCLEIESQLMKALKVEQKLQSALEEAKAALTTSSE